MIFPAGTRATKFHPRASAWTEKPQRETKPRKPPAKSYFAEKLEQALKAWQCTK